MSNKEWKTVISHTQAPYKAIRKKTSGGGQSSYNLSNHGEIYETFNHDGVLVEKERSESGDNIEITYEISGGSTLVIDKKIANLIGRENIPKKPNLKFSYTSIKNKTNGALTKKLQLKRVKNSTAETKWFQKLYDANTENSEFIIKYNSERKEIYVDINTILPRETLMNSDEIYKNTSYKNKPSDQIIYYGVPGTGKSFQVTADIKKYYKSYPEKDDDNIIRITIHPEYSYYDFVGTVMPTIEESDKGKVITYDFIPGPFTVALKRALMEENKNNPVFLVIEEMSRGDIGAVFGDIFQLLDRKNGVSEYGIKNSLIGNYVSGNPDFTIKIPVNFNILGTLNTSDQNVFIMDNAFQRRFKFKYVSTNPVKKDENEYMNDFVFDLGGKKVSWIDFYQKFNAFVVEKMGLLEDKQIGQFFVKFSDEKNENDKFDLIRFKVLKYIWNDIHNTSVNSVDIIASKIKSFDVAFNKLSSHENIFCDDFFDNLEEKSENING